MEILEAYDLTQCAHSAAQLVGCDEKTVARYVALRDAGRDPAERERRARSIDPFLGKIEELVEASQGRIRADVVHDKLTAMGFDGTDRTTRRAVAELKASYRAGHRRKYRPGGTSHAVGEDPGAGHVAGSSIGARARGSVAGVPNCSARGCRGRGLPVVVPAWDQQLPTLIACLDTTLRRIGGAPTYLLTDNPRTVTMDRIAGVPVRHPDIVSAGRHYGCVVHTCEPFDPESKGGAEHTVKIAKADLVPTEANLLEEYPSFADLVDAYERWCEKVNARPHRAVGAAPAERLATELGRLHVLPEDPHLLALGEERLVGFDQTVSWGNVRYSTPDGHQPAKVWCRVTGDELVIVARTGSGVAEIARHRLSTPGNPRIVAAHYPHHRRRRIGAAPAQTPPAHRGRDRLPRPRRGRTPLADRGRRRRGRPDPPQDGQGSRIRPRPRAPDGSIRHWPWPRRRAGSATVISPRSSTTLPPLHSPDLWLWSTKPTPLGPGTAGWGRVGA
ncbi:IS21 family transposase [Rhodococcus opacus]|uniref:IS21 family transposase n=1 Tax=Rhodococcus opacus TaxID=37919 RepID=UPI00211DD08A|nr:IS21 family transposase [Rhodococcus opacus]